MSLTTVQALCGQACEQIRAGDRSQFPLLLNTLEHTIKGTIVDADVISAEKTSGATALH